MSNGIGRNLATCMLALTTTMACAQSAELAGHVELPAADKAAAHKPAVVLWLNPHDRSLGVAAPQPRRFTLLQKNRMFSPHLLVVPVGSVVSFPNADPFFHNVFSLFNGKRFDLGLYEAGSIRDVVFSREGTSYIFCNIHPEMSAVVLALSTSLYAVADSSGRYAIHHIPAGEYDLHVWIEGTPQPTLDGLTRLIHAHPGEANEASIDASHAKHASGQHLNKFGKPYDRDTKPTY